MDIMQGQRSGETTIDSYTIKGTENIIKGGDSVLMRSRNPQNVALVEKFEKDGNNNVSVHARWYYKPEEAVGGRRNFHGRKELFLSDHYDVLSADAIIGKCNVHTFEDYMKLENKGANDFYSRLQYNVATGAFTPDSIAVFCICEMPYNPDALMIKCTRCRDWYHLDCLGLTMEEANARNPFECSDCSSSDEENEPTDMEEVGENVLPNIPNEVQNGNRQESSQVPTVVNPSQENMEGSENQAQERECSTQNSVNDIEIAVSSVRRVMNVLNNMEGLESGSDMWCQTLYLLEDPVRRVFFLNMKDDACRLAWIKFRCDIEAK